MINYQEALEVGMAMAKKAAGIFWHQNQWDYRKITVSAEDLQGYLFETVLVPKYLKTVETQPAYYPAISHFKASLYRAYRNALLVHQQAHVKCQKRGDILRASVLELDRDLQSSGSDGGEAHVELATQGHAGYLERVKEMVDTCPCAHSARGLILLAYGRCESKTDLRRKFLDFLAMTKAQFEAIWNRILTHMRQFAFCPTSVAPVFQN